MAITEIFVSFFLEITSSSFFLKIKRDLSFILNKTIIEMKYKKAEMFENGSLFSRVSSDVDIVVQLITRDIFFGLQSLFKCLIISGILIKESLFIFTITISLVVLNYFISYRIALSNNEYYVTKTKNIDEYNNKIINYISKLLYVKSMRFEKSILNEVEASIYKNYNFNIKFVGRYSKQNILLNLCNSAYIIFILIYGIEMAKNGDVGIGSYIASYMYSFSLRDSITSITNFRWSIKNANINFLRIEELLKCDDKDNQIKNTLIKRFDITNGKFKHRNQIDYLINDFEGAFETGKIYAVVGENGVGKTTLLKIIKGIYNFEESENFYLSDYVSDRSVLLLEGCPCFENNVMDIVSYGAEKSEQSKINELLTYFNLDYLTKREISNERLEFSAGEKQMLGFANAVYQDPDIFLLDEVSSNLDANKKKIVIETLHKLKENKIIILSTHDNELISNSDVIIRF